MGSKALKLSTVITLIVVLSSGTTTRVKYQSGWNRPLRTSGSSLSNFPSFGPTVFVDPDEIVGSVNDLVTFSVKVFNLTDNTVDDPSWPPYQIPLGNLWSIGLNFTWDPAILQYVGHTKTMPVETYPNGVLHDPISIIFEDIDQAAGWYHLSASGSAGSTPFNNPDASNTIFEMTFNVIDLGSSLLSLLPAALSLGDDGMVPIGEDHSGDKIYLNIEDGLFTTVGPGETDIYVTTKPSNQQGILYGVNVTAFDALGVIASGISNTSGIVTFTDIPFGDVTFVAYAGSDYNQIIANQTVLISVEGQSFDLICDRNYGGVSIGWNLIINVSHSMLAASLPLVLFSTRPLIRKDKKTRNHHLSKETGKSQFPRRKTHKIGE